MLLALTIVEPAKAQRWVALVALVVFWAAYFWLWHNCEAVDVHFGEFYPC
jgi:hypothetical protein